MKPRNLDPNKRNPLQGGTHEAERGEQQRRGGAPLAVPPTPANIPVCIAPPDPRVVVSNFDTRPIGAYDFAIPVHLVWEVNTEEGTPPLVFQARVADGYTAALRRVRVEFNPPITPNWDPGNIVDRFLRMRVLRNSGAIPNNEQQLRAPVADFVWDTHHVYGMRELIGLRIDAPDGLDAPNPVGSVPGGVSVTVTFEGTFIPSKSMPPETEIASDPVLVKIYKDPKLIADGERTTP